MKTASLVSVIIGILFLLAGIVFAFQGSGLLAGSSMTGVSFWLYAGVVLAIVGLVIVFAGFWMGARKAKATTQTSL
jgi:hypothetical protein